MPFKLGIVLKSARKLFGISNILTKLFPSLYMELKQAKMPFKPAEYVGIALFCFIFYFSILSLLLFSLGIFARMLTINYILTVMAGSAFMSGFVFYYIVSWPKLILIKKVRFIEKDLLYALRHLLIQVRSGVTLFNSLVSVSSAGYGLISDEFEIAVKEINAGVPEIEALDNMAFKNPSLHFRRVVWQLVNSLRAGSDVANTLKEIVNNLGYEQRIEIRKYGAQMNPMALIYMMSAVIIPSLGITFLIILSSFIGFTTIPLDFALYGILAFLVFFQFMFMGLIKTRRPALEV